MGRSELDIMLIEKLQRENQLLGRLYANTKKELEAVRVVDDDYCCDCGECIYCQLRAALRKLDAAKGEKR